MERTKPRAAKAPAKKGKKQQATKQPNGIFSWLLEIACVIGDYVLVADKGVAKIYGRTVIPHNMANPYIKAIWETDILANKGEEPSKDGKD